MEDEAKSSMGLVVGQAIGEIRALHRRIDSLERDITSMTNKLDRRPSRAKRYLLVFVMLLLLLVVASAIILYRFWTLGHRVF